MSTKPQSRTASRFSAKTLTMCAIFTALVAVCSQITIPLPLIPINLARFAVYLAGALLGPWRGARSLLLAGRKVCLRAEESLAVYDGSTVQQTATASGGRQLLRLGNVVLVCYDARAERISLH